MKLSGLKRDETVGWRGSSFAGAAMQAPNAGAVENTRTVKTVHFTPGLGTALKCWNHFHLKFHLPISFADFRSVEYQSDSISQAWPAPLIFH